LGQPFGLALDFAHCIGISVGSDHTAILTGQYNYILEAFAIIFVVIHLNVRLAHVMKHFSLFMDSGSILDYFGNNCRLNATLAYTLCSMVRKLDILQISYLGLKGAAFISHAAKEKRNYAVNLHTCKK